MSVRLTLNWNLPGREGLSSLTKHHACRRRVLRWRQLNPAPVHILQHDTPGAECPTHLCVFESVRQSLSVHICLNGSNTCYGAKHFVYTTCYAAILRTCSSVHCLCWPSLLMRHCPEHVDELVLAPLLQADRCVPRTTSSILSLCWSRSVRVAA